MVFYERYVNDDKSDTKKQHGIYIDTTDFNVCVLSLHRACVNNNLDLTLIANTAYLNHEEARKDISNLQ